jgi:hypothetical protein
MRLISRFGDWFCLRLQVEPTQLGPINIYSKVVGMRLISRFGDWFCLRLQVEPTQLGPINRYSKVRVKFLTLFLLAIRITSDSIS